MRRAFAGVSQRALDPFIHMDQMGEVEYAPGEPKGTPWHPHRGFETVTYMIDGEMAAPGLARRRRAHHQRRHAVDDGRRGHPAHRDPARAPGDERRALPRPAALGEPAEGGEVRGPALPGHHRRQGRAARDRGRRRARPRHRRRGRRPRRPRVDAHARSRSCTRPSPRARRSSLPWRPDFNALVYALSGTARSAPRAPRSPAASSRCFGAGDTLMISADRRQDARHAAGLDVYVLGGRPIREPVVRVRPVRHEHPRRGRAGVRGLPGRPPRGDPGGARPRRRRRLLRGPGRLTDPPPLRGERADAPLLCRSGRSCGYGSRVPHYRIRRGRPAPRRQRRHAAPLGRLGPAARRPRTPPAARRRRRVLARLAEEVAAAAPEPPAYRSSASRRATGSPGWSPASCATP